MRKFIVVSLILGLAVAGTGQAASADQPTHILKQTVSGTFSAPAGTVCDFDFFLSYTIVDTGVMFDDGSYVINVGIVWHLRDADGKIVVVKAGQIVFDTDTGELLKVTPNINPDGAAVLCPALGGQLAT